MGRQGRCLGHEAMCSDDGLLLLLAFFALGCCPTVGSCLPWLGRTRPLDEAGLRIRHGALADGSRLGEEEVGTAVLLTALLGSVVSDWAGLAIAFRRQPARVDAALGQVIHDRFGAISRQRQVLGGLALGVGVALDPQLDLRIFLQQLNNLVKLKEVVAITELPVITEVVLAMETEEDFN